jgi:NTE family protein
MRAIVFGGGGAKSSFSLGVLSQLKDNLYDVSIGTSSGALNAAGYSHLGFDGLKRIWMGIKSRSDVMSFNLSRKGVFDLDPLAKMVKKIVAKPFIIPAVCCAVRLEDGSLCYSESGDADFADMIIASCSISGAIVPLEKDGSTYVDGGVLENCPLQHAIDLGADQIDVILCNPLEWDGVWTPPTGDLFPVTHYVARAFDLMCHEMLKDDLRARMSTKITVYAPHCEPCDIFDFDHESIITAYDMGAMCKPVVL